MKIAKKLQIIKKMTGFTQEQLAKYLGVTFVTLNTWINDKSQPRQNKNDLIDELYKKVTGQNIIPESELQSKKEIITSQSKLYKKVIKTIRNNPDIYDELSLLLTYHSNSIEGSTFTEKDTASVMFDDVTIRDKSMIDHLEVKNHQTAFAFLMDQIKKDYVIKESFIFELHRILMNGIMSDAGYYRNHGVRIVGAGVPTSNYLRVSELMKKLVKDIGKDEKDIINHVTKIHSRFEQIHPFSDGNGRIGRLLIIMMLLRKNLAPALIRQENKRMYYTFLRRSQVDDDYTLLEDFICDAVIFGYELIKR